MKTIATLILSLIFTGGIAQNNMGEIKGNLIDVEYDDALFGAVVYVKDGEQKIMAKSDMEGKFTIKPLRPGIYNFHVTAPEKAEKVIEGVVVDPDKITWLKDIEMHDSNMLVTYTVETYKVPLIKPEDPTAQTISAKMIKNSPVLRQPAKLIGSISSEISVSESGDVYVRGSRNDAVMYYIDGVKSQTMSGIPGSAIGSITVYTGGVPAKYGDVTGGVIILETKSYFDLYNERKNSH